MPEARPIARGFFITGTDTGVGKTVISGAIIKALHLLGLSPGAMKPAETGCSREGDVLMPFDGSFLKQIAKMDDPITQVTPCCLVSPLAPLAASEVDMIQIDTASFKSAFDKLSEKYGVMVVEGIGGLMVPITEQYFVVDMAREIGLPLLIVARPGLGTLNHTLLTIRCAEAEGLTVAGIILNQSYPSEDTPAERTNVKMLTRLCNAPIIGVFPYLKNISEMTLEMAALRNFDLELIKKHL